MSAAEVAAAFRRAWGRGPVKTTAYWATPASCSCSLEDGHNDSGAATLREKGYVKGARRPAVPLQEIVEPEPQTGVERATGRAIRATLSATHVAPRRFGGDLPVRARRCPSGLAASAGRDAALARGAGRGSDVPGGRPRSGLAGPLGWRLRRLMIRIATPRPTMIHQLAWVAPANPLPIAPDSPGARGRRRRSRRRSLRPDLPAGGPDRRGDAGLRRRHPRHGGVRDRGLDQAEAYAEHREALSRYAGAGSGRVIWVSISEPTISGDRGDQQRHPGSAPPRRCAPRSGRAQLRGAGHRQHVEPRRPSGGQPAYVLEVERVQEQEATEPANAHTAIALAPENGPPPKNGSRAAAEPPQLERHQRAERASADTQNRPMISRRGPAARLPSMIA